MTRKTLFLVVMCQQKVVLGKLKLLHHIYDDNLKIIIIVFVCRDCGLRSRTPNVRT